MMKLLERNNPMNLKAMKTRMNPMAAVAAAICLALALPGAGIADTLTWTGGASGTWSAAGSWKNSSGNTVAWSDGSDAVITMTTATTIAIPGAVSAASVTVSGNYTLTLDGGGSLSWSGWYKNANSAKSVLNVVVSGSSGAHFDVGNTLTLNGANTYTGGTFFTNSTTTLRGVILGSDAALGAVPGSPAENIHFLGGKVALLAASGKSVELNANRTIKISDGATCFTAPQGTLRIPGAIVGENAANGSPTGTALSTESPWWHGTTILSGTNSVGRLFVTNKLEIAAGRTTLTTASQGVNANAALQVAGTGKGYSATYGHLAVSGGTLINYQTGYRFQTSQYGQLDICGGEVRQPYNTAGNGTYGQFLNGYSTPGKITVRDGGYFQTSWLRLSQCQTAPGGEFHLCTNGMARVRYVGRDFTSAASYKGTFHFNGGALQSLEGNSGTSVTQEPDNGKWEGLDFVVEAGGAILDTSNGQDVWFGRPLLAGLADGETDGGLVARLGGGRSVVLTSAGNTFTGPVRTEAVGAGSGARTLQIRAANALPASATLQVGPGTRVGFSSDFATTDLAQTVARLEGTGAVVSNSLLAVTGAVAPVFDGAYGTLSLEKTCALSGDYEIAGDASGCSCLFVAAGQNVSGLTLAVADFSALNSERTARKYKILDAPDGFAGKFAAGNVAAPWFVEYTSTGAYLRYANPFMMIVR